MNNHSLAETAALAETKAGDSHIQRKGRVLVSQGGVVFAVQEDKLRSSFVCFHHVFKLPYLQLQDSAK